MADASDSEASAVYNDDASVSEPHPCPFAMAGSPWSEYWKSVPRKFCDFCKCWITDNKPSVEFHERGKRHQENVQLRLKEIRKKTHEKSQEDAERAKQMEKIEKAALEALKKDIKKNPELAAQYGVSLEPKPKVAKKDPETSDSGTSTPSDDKSKEEEKKATEWYEAKSPEGYSYYWSSITGESKWEAPGDFVSLAEQEAEQEEEEKKREEEALVNSEAPTVTTRVDHQSSRSAFGSWSVVKEESQAVIYNESSEAPVLEDIPLPEAATKIKPVKEKFREKTVSSLGSTSSANVTFKKRKIASGARNVRQRDNDD